MVAKKCLSEEQYQDFEVCRFISCWFIRNDVYLFKSNIVCFDSPPNENLNMCFHCMVIFEGEVRGSSGLLTYTY